MGVHSRQVKLCTVKLVQNGQARMQKISYRRTGRAYGNVRRQNAQVLDSLRWVLNCTPEWLALELRFEFSLNLGIIIWSSSNICSRSPTDPQWIPP